MHREIAGVPVAPCIKERQITRFLGKRSPSGIWIAVDQRAAVEWREQPFVRINDEAVGALDAIEQRTTARRCQCCSAVSTVDMHPYSAVSTHLADTCEIIDDAQVGGACCGYHCSHTVTMFVECSRYFGARQPVVIVDINLDHVGIHDRGHRRHRRVGLLRCNERPPIRTRLALLGQPMSSIVSGCDHGRQIAHGAAGHEYTTGGVGHTHEPSEPVERLVLGPYGAGPLEPRAAVNRTCADDQIKQHRSLGWGRGHKREVPLIVNRQ